MAHPEVMDNTDDHILDVSIRPIFTPENGCMGGGCGVYELVVEYPVSDGNCHLGSMIGFRTVQDVEWDLFGNSMACCSGVSGTIAEIYIDDDIPDGYDQMTVRDFIQEYGPDEIANMIDD